MVTLTPMKHGCPHRAAGIRGARWFWLAACVAGSLPAAESLPAPPPPPPPAPSRASDWNAAAETVVVYNTSFRGSKELAEFYAGKRHVPAERLVGIECPNDETISRDDFENHIRGTLLRTFQEKKWWLVETRDRLDPNGRPIGRGPEVVQQNVRVVVLMRGMPLRINRSAKKPDAVATDADEASVDSEIASLGLLGRPIAGPLENRYYQSLRRFADHYDARGQLLVARLDAADDATARRMVEDSLQAERDGLWGRAAIDLARKDGPYAEGEQWLTNCVKLFRDSGIPVFADQSRELLPDGWPLPDTIFYFGWYADSIRGAPAAKEFRFRPGAIACHLHSFSAETLRNASERWCAPLLDHGAAAVLGNVWEPYLTLTCRFDLMSARLLDGFTLGEAAWSATPALSWMNVLVGDPLYTPFPKNRPAEAKRPADADYAAYLDLTRRLLLRDAKKFRRELLWMAEQKKNGQLLEFGGMFLTLEGAFGEAEDFYLHARALHQNAADQLRCALYAAELSRRAGKAGEGLHILKGISEDPRFTKLPGRNAAVALERESGAGAK